MDTSKEGAASADVTVQAVADTSAKPPTGKWEQNMAVTADIGAGEPTRASPSSPMHSPSVLAVHITRMRHRSLAMGARTDEVEPCHAPATGAAEVEPRPPRALPESPPPRRPWAPLSPSESRASIPEPGSTVAEPRRRREDPPLLAHPAVRNAPPKPTARRHRRPLTCQGSERVEPESGGVDPGPHMVDLVAGRRRYHARGLPPSAPCMGTAAANRKGARGREKEEREGRSPAAAFLTIARASGGRSGGGEAGWQAGAWRCCGVGATPELLRGGATRGTHELARYAAFFFLQYRQMRREQDRLARMDADYQRRKEMAEFKLRRKERLKAAEERTAKKRLKRQKKQQRKKEKRTETGNGGEEPNAVELSDDDEGSDDDKSKQCRVNCI